MLWDDLDSRTMRFLFAPPKRPTQEKAMRVPLLALLAAGSVVCSVVFSSAAVIGQDIGLFSRFVMPNRDD